MVWQNPSQGNILSRRSYGIEDSIDEFERQRQARRLQELFRGRFTNDEAQQLLINNGGLSEAVDFVLKGDPAEIRTFINRQNDELLHALRQDAEHVQRSLVEGVTHTIRLFACGGCDRFWWRKVPARKEVSKCRVCKVKYDPVPRQEEWGLAEFNCNCGKIFRGTGWMNHTKSPCYACGAPDVQPTRILPPVRHRTHTQKQQLSHSCTAPNCYNRAESPPTYSRTQRFLGAVHHTHERPVARGGRVDQAAQRKTIARTSARSAREVLVPSPRHVSTGSTVDTFLTQGELDETYEGIMSLPSIAGSD
ncbi:repressor of yield of DENV protein homolog [Pomacea canaliculata]|uniref:repressor of yield of DENV protein homolog n=1 Tax=Pomacea canaliculata TaxID=400727 RepID=UPI000D73735E|nr:repressor of yield of DENV protein homolog [Pomacea canaliculata]